MFDQTDLDRLITAMRATGVTTLQAESNGDQLCIVLAPGHTPCGAAASASAQPETMAAKSQGIGTFVPRGIDDGLPPLAPSAEVQPDEILGYVCQGPVRGLVTAPAAGRLISTPPESGTVFGYGDTVFQMEVKP